jgi:hypothetical protein
MHLDELNEVDESLAFTTDDELELLRGSSLAIILATIRFSQERGVDLREWTTSLSRAFAGGWDVSEPWSPEEFIDAVLLNLQAFGADSPMAEYEDDSARARITAFPDYDRVEGMGLGDVPGDVLFDLFSEVAAACGLRWSWQRDEEGVWIEARAAER